MTDSNIASVVQVLDHHRWKTMGVDSVECECGAILTSTEPPLTRFPADEVFRLHMAQFIVAALDIDLLTTQLEAEQENLQIWKDLLRSKLDDPLLVFNGAPGYIRKDALRELLR
jgi:hypothetical protein